MKILRQCRRCGDDFYATNNAIRYCSRDCAFWDKVDASGECWLWTGSLRGRKGRDYGLFRVGDRVEMAHRYSWLMHHRELPEYPAKVIMHTCDNCRCVRPSHLRAATQSENIRDCARKQRKGKLSHDDVRDIRRLVWANVKRSHVAILYDIDSSHVTQIMNGKLWADVR